MISTPTIESNCAAWWRYQGISAVPNPIRTEGSRLYYAKDVANYVYLLASMGRLKPWPSKNHGEDVEQGYREFVSSCSAQLVIHRTEVEMDFDYHNPGWGDLFSFFGHAGEVAYNWIFRKKTDQKKIAKLLQERGIYV